MSTLWLLLICQACWLFGRVSRSLLYESKRRIKPFRG